MLDDPDGHNPEIITVPYGRDRTSFGALIRARRQRIDGGRGRHGTDQCGEGHMAPGYRPARQVSVPCDYDTAPERYRLGMRSARAHTAADLYRRVARLLGELGASTVLDVGCADGPLRAALPTPGPWLVGLDVSETLLRDHPPPVLLADTTRLPVHDCAVDAVTALNVLYHLPDPMPALREARRVLRAGGHLLAATIARTDSPEFSTYWTRSATSFDAEDAPGLLARVFDSVAVFSWDAPLVTLPDAAAIRDYLVGRQVRTEIAVAAAHELPTPLDVTKRGALIVAGRDR